MEIHFTRRVVEGGSPISVRRNEVPADIWNMLELITPNINMLAVACF